MEVITATEIQDVSGPYLCLSVASFYPVSASLDLFL